MIEYYLGLPGSGKTYRAVDHVYNAFLDPKSKTFGKYDRFFTNINEFKFDSFNTPTKIDSRKLHSKREIETSESALGRFEQFATFTRKPKIETHDGKNVLTFSDDDEKVAYLLDMDQLLISLGELRDLYLSKVGDSVLLERADELKLSNTLFIIDEAHNFFDTKNDVLVWWLSYHRHLHQDIILITQNLALIYRKYLTFGEFFYRAVPSSLRLRGGVFTYHQFVNYKLYKTSHTDTIKVKFNQAVYDLYGSGANTQGKKVILKFIIIGFVLFLIVVIFFKFISFGSGGNHDKNGSDSVNSLSSSSVSTVDRTASFTIVCVGFDCIYMGQTLSLPELNGYEKKYALHSLETTVVSDGVMLRSYTHNDNFLSEVINVSSDSSANH